MEPFYTVTHNVFHPEFGDTEVHFQNFADALEYYNQLPPLPFRSTIWLRHNNLWYPLGDPGSRT